MTDGRHERWCPHAEGYNGPFMPELVTDRFGPWDGVTCYCDDSEQADVYFDAMDRQG